MIAQRLAVTAIIIVHLARCVFIPDEWAPSAGDLINAGVKTAVTDRIPGFIKKISTNTMHRLGSPQPIDPERAPLLPTTYRLKSTYAGTCCSTIIGTLIVVIAIAFVTLSAMLPAALAGVCTEALTVSHDVDYILAAAWLLVNSSLAGTLVGFFTQLAWLPVSVTLALMIARTKSGIDLTMSLMTAVAMLMSIALSGYVSSSMADQEPMIGVRCALIYAAAIAPFKCIANRIADVNGHCFLKLLCVAAPCGAGSLSLYLTVPNYPNYGAGVVMGLFNQGMFASIAAKFPVPPAM